MKFKSSSFSSEFNQFIETANAPIVGIDTNGRVNEWNEMSVRITGYSKAEALGEDLIERYIAEDYRKSVKKVLDSALKGEETSSYEFPLFTKKGSRVMLLLNASTRRNMSGKITGVLGVGQDITELDYSRSETESVASELRQFIETANAPIIGIDTNGIVNEWNEMSEKITGYSKAEALGEDLLERYITEDYRKSVKEVLDSALKGKGTSSYEFPLFTKSGSRVMVLLNASTRRNMSGEITGVLGVGQDITELDHSRSETESVASELRQFIETANAPIIGIDTNGIVNEWNEMSEKITGYSKAEALGEDLLERYITEDYRKSVKEVLDSALKGKGTSSYEFPLFTKNRSRVMVLLNASTRRDMSGEITGVLGVGQDITELDYSRSETESVASELRQFIETANAPIIGIDTNGIVNEWNEMSEKITGYSKAEALGEDLLERYITEDYRKSVKEVLDSALKGKGTSSYEFPLFTKNRSRVMVLLNASTRRNMSGEITGVLGVGQDITVISEYRSSLESEVQSRTVDLEELLESEKELGLLKNSFVSMASHEFRTPLTTISVNADIILRYFDKLSPGEFSDHLEKIKDEVGGMTTMLEDILIIGKLDSKKSCYSPDLLDVVSLIKGVVSDYQATQVNYRAISYVMKSPCKIMANLDRKWIKHIVINLISNAIKYSSDDKNIEINVTKDQTGINLSFKDYGLGILEEDIKHLFEPFRRGRNVQTIQGSGLGLVVVKKAVDLHKGEIKVESEIGKGSKFTIIFPIN